MKSKLFCYLDQQVCAIRHLNIKGYTKLTDVAGEAINSDFGGDACELFLCSDPETIVVDIDCEGFDVCSCVLHLHPCNLHIYIVTN